MLSISDILALAFINYFNKKYPPKAERTSERNLEFSQWIRNNCRPSRAFCRHEQYNFIELGALTVHDLDFIFYDYKRKVIQLIEVKTKVGKVSYSQQQIMNLIDQLLKIGAEQLKITYLGYHVVSLDGTTPDNSTKILWDGQQVDVDELRYYLNMVSTLHQPFVYP